MTTKLENILGESVINHNGDKIPVKTLCVKDKVIGLYFSAYRWSPPCRTFTPKLVKFYEDIKQTSKGVNFEIIFISWDKDDSSFNDYLKLMPWLALPYELRDKKTILTKKYRVQGIPKLVLVDGDSGRTITTDGYRHVLDDETALEFPWRRKPFNELIKGKLFKNVGDTTEDVEACEAIKGKIVGLYFSAHWCPPCRAFTADLIHVCEKVKEKGVQFEVIFCSSDRSEESFSKYFSNMPWLSIPFGDRRLDDLKEIFTIDGIPTLLIFDEFGETVTMNGRAALLMDKEGEEFPWYPKPFELTGGAALTLNESSCLVLFTEGEDEDVAKAKNVLSDVALREHSKGDDQELYVYYGGDDEICDSVRDFANLDDTCPLLVILDLPEQNVYVYPETEITKDIVAEFVRNFYAGTLEAQSLRQTNDEG